MATEQDVIQLIPGYVLGSLSDEETALVEQFLETSAVVRTEYDSFKNTADNLALAVPLVELPGGLKDRVFARIDEVDESLLPAPHPVTETQQPGTLATAKPESKQTFQLDPPRPSLLNMRLVPVMLGVSLVFNAVFAWMLLSRPTVEEPQETELATVVHTISLVNNENTEHGIIVVSDDGEHGTLIVSGLPPLEEGQHYEIILRAGGNQHSGGIFSVADSGYASVAIDAPLPLSVYTEFGVTVEPDGETAPPNTDLILRDGGTE